jgi:predicted nucleic acid-binding protein
MSVFVDSNVLLRTADPGDPKHTDAVHSIASLIAAGQSLVMTPQIAAEFWNVATRPAGKNGLGMSIDEVREEIVELEGFLSILEESIDVYAEWKRLVVAHGVSGVQVHDVRIVAAMNVYGIAELLTFNVQDFRRFTGIKASAPEQP